MQVLIAGDHEPTTQRIRDLLTLHGVACPAGHVVPLESAVDRASRLGPELLMVAFSPKPSAGLATVREARNTLRNAETMVVGPTKDAQLILQTLHEGADEYLDEDQIEAQLGDALARLKAKHGPHPELRKTGERETGKVITVLSPSGGCGSSTLAANISVVLARQHGQCALIDLRLQAGDLASMLNLTPTHTMTDLCQRLARVDQSMFERFFVQHSSGTHLLAAPNECGDADLVNGKVVRQALAMARTRFPYVVVDLDNVFQAEQVEALWQSDEILLVLRLDYTSLRNARRVLDRFVELGLGTERVQAVVNAYGQPQQLSAGQVEEALGISPKHYIPNDPARVNRAINRGTPVVLHHPFAKITRKITHLAMSVNGQ